MPWCKRTEPQTLRFPASVSYPQASNNENKNVKSARLMKARRPPLDKSPDEIDRELETVARWMDTVFEIPGLGWRFGLDALLGLIPGLGDTATALVSLYILGTASRYGVPKITLARMGLNIAIDWLLGSLPIVGDLFDVWWKSNVRNVELLRKRATLTRASEARRASAGDWLFVGLIMMLLLGILAFSLFVAWSIVAFGVDLIRGK